MYIFKYIYIYIYVYVYVCVCVQVYNSTTHIAVVVIISVREVAFTETKKQSPNTGARANNTLHKKLGYPIEEPAGRVRATRALKHATLLTWVRVNPGVSGGCIYRVNPVVNSKPRTTRRAPHIYPDISGDGFQYHSS